MIRTIILTCVMASGALWGQSAKSASAPAPKPAAATNTPAGTPAPTPGTHAAMPASEADAPAGEPPAGTQPRHLIRHPHRHALLAKAPVASDGAGTPAATADAPLAKVAAATESRARMAAVVAEAPAPKPSAATTHSRYRPERFSKRAGLYYDLQWGVDSLSAKWTESGEVIRFSYRVLDADKAKALNDKRAEPSLIDARAGVKLVVPSLEKIGQLRQSSTPVAGKSYWMAFSNKGRPVKRGDHVDVVIGKFRAEGLVVD